MARTLGWAVMSLLALGVAGYAFAGVAGFRSPFVEALFAEKALRAFGHLAAGGVAIIAGALQFSTRLRFDRPVVHRTLGKVYVVAALISGTAGGLLAVRSTGGVTAHFGFGLLAFLWIATSVIAYTSVRSGDYAAHRGWMIRSYALCLAAVMLRIYLPIFGVAGVPFELSYPAISWLCWVPNIIVAEWLVVGSTLAPLEPAD